MDDTASKCIALIAQSKNLPVADISLESTLEELGLDSLDKVNLSFAVEEMFNISIPDNALAQLRTVGDVVRGVEQLQTPAQQAGA